LALAKVNGNENSMNDLAAAQARRRELVGQMNTLQAELRVIDARIDELSKTVDCPELPCWQCRQSQAEWIRHLLRSGCGAQIAKTPSGVPMTCCQITVAQTRSTIAATL
jgi:hypothetical protein